jgi:hypothetical protein
MLWQYRTSLFEFTKDGLLGDKYVDDEEMEKILNELGGKEWELVSVSLLQDGLLAFLKRPLREEVAEAPPLFVEPVAAPVLPSRPAIFSRETVTDEQDEEERAPIRGLDRQRKTTRQTTEEMDFIGDIKIS